MRLLIGVCAFRRPLQLTRLIDSLAEATVPDGWDVDLVVVDNDPAGSSAPAMAAARSVGGTGGGVSLLSLGATNISAARNAVLDSAIRDGHDLVAFVDDDEWVARDWLEQLGAALTRHGADVVIGPVVGVLPPGAPSWMEPYFAVLPGPDGARLHEGITGNVLFRLDAVRRTSVRFDVLLGRSGGEDQVFFRSLDRAGLVLRAAAAAMAYEEVPDDRARVRYLVRRSFRIGNTLGLIDAHLLVDGRSRGVRCVKALVWGCRGVARAILGATVAWSPRGRGIVVRGATEVARAAGMLHGVRGRQHQFYDDHRASRRRQERDVRA